MERLNEHSPTRENSLLSEIFDATRQAGLEADPEARARNLRRLHERLSSPQFVDQMTGVFFEAKRSALVGAK